MNDRIQTLIHGRRERLARRLLRPLEASSSDESSAPLSDEAHEHLVEYAEELYWNEIEWEKITAEEETQEGPVAQLIFPGFLAYVRGLLLEEVMDDALAPAEPRPEVVEDVIRFLARRIVELDEGLDGDAENAFQLRTELELADHLLDLVLYLYYGLSEAEVERLEEARQAGPGRPSVPAARSGD